ncbi:MAG TPA: hypothetical protein VIJ95_10860 [Hanamia sp.]
MAISAALTGDIVNSTRLGKVNERKLLRILKQILNPYLFEFYRGDSFQVYVKDPKSAFRIALLCRAAAISISLEDETISSDVRISIGVGKITTPIKTLGAAKGEAFLLSGRSFDEIAGSETRISIVTSNTLANEGLQVVSDYVNAIFNTMTSKQAEVIFELLKGKTQQEVAKKFKRTKSTISQHVSAGRWNEIEKLLKQYENIINQLI